MLYVSVSNADAAAKHAKAAGGAVLKDAFDVGESGRMAILQDPTGAVFSVWQAPRNRNRTRGWNPVLG
jgi:predicted enzyme related to lactoylglutathione lyase